MDDKFKPFFGGVAVTICLVGIAIIGIAIMSHGDVPEEQLPTKVVGTYKECDIVKWANHQLADYKYFLYCGENK